MRLKPILLNKEEWNNAVGNKYAFPMKKTPFIKFIFSDVKYNPIDNFYGNIKERDFIMDNNF
jgi:hypothetical protein